MQQSDLFQEKERQGYSPLRVVGGEDFLGRSEDGACVFLEQDACAYHARYGGEAKPVTCQLYPFQVVESPDGVWVSLSFACPAVLAGQGKPASGYKADIARLVSEPGSSPTRLLTDGRFLLSETISGDWDCYLALESALLSILHNDCPSLYILNSAAHLISLREDSFAGAETVRALDFSEPSPLLGELMNLMELFLSHTLAFLEYGSEPEERARFCEQLQSGNRPHSRRFGVELPLPGGRKAPDLLTLSALHRYCVNQVLGKRLLLGPTLATRLLMLGTSAAIIEYLSETLSSQNRKLHFSFENMERVFSAIESDVMSHSTDLVPIFLEFERAVREVSVARSSS